MARRGAPLSMILISTLFLSAVLAWGEDYLLVINGSGYAEEDPRYIGSFEHLPFERSIDRNRPDHPVKESSPLDFQPRISLSHRDERHLFMVEEEDRIYEIEGRLVYGDERSRCLIYAERGGKYGEEYDWERIGRFFDRRIYPVLTRSFGPVGDIDRNGKVVILYYSFLDDSMLGYFSAGDLASRREIESSNEMEILYMNSGYGNPASSDMMETLPHEFLHLINYSVRQRRGYREMDLWMDEGLAESAAELVMKRPLLSNLEIFEDAAFLPWSGTALCAWGERDEDYAMSYLFMQYLKVQAGTTEIFRKMIRHPLGTSFSLPLIMKDYVPEFESFPAILKGLYLALLLDEDEGIYGFKGMNRFYQVEPGPAEASFGGYLYPGGAVYLPLPEGALKMSENPEQQIMVIDTREFR